MTAELGGSWRAFEEGDAAVAAFALEVGPELGAAIDLDGQTGKGRSAWSLSRKRLALCALARRQAWAQVRLATRSRAAISWPCPHGIVGVRFPDGAHRVCGPSPPAQAVRASRPGFQAVAARRLLPAIQGGAGDAGPPQPRRRRSGRAPRQSGSLCNMTGQAGYLHGVSSKLVCATNSFRDPQPLLQEPPLTSVQTRSGSWSGRFERIGGSGRDGRAGQRRPAPRSFSVSAWKSSK